MCTGSHVYNCPYDVSHQFIDKHFQRRVVVDLCAVQVDKEEDVRPHVVFEANVMLETLKKHKTIINPLTNTMACACLIIILPIETIDPYENSLNPAQTRRRTRIQAVYI